MKLYTRSEIIKMLDFFQMNDDAIVQFIVKLDSIEIPSDEEIYNASPFHDGTEYSLGEHNGFNKGAKWMRDKILKK